MSRTTRPATLSRNGMVASPHYLASAAGLRVLQDGGTAVDAAIAINSTLGVVYPHMTGAGGDAFWLIHDAASGTVHALNGSGRAGSQATREFFLEGGHASIPVRGPLAAITVPGTVDSWCTAHERFGALPLSDVLAPAIGYARDGYPVSMGQAAFTIEAADVLGQHETTREVLLPHDRPPLRGEIMRLTGLADTLQAVAGQGRAGFYEGPVADTIVAALQRAGGLLTREDLASQRSEWTDPISTTYRGFECYQHPPNCQGLVHLMVLNILEGFDLAAMGSDSADYVHAVVEATKLAFIDRDRYLTDPHFSDIPLADLLSKEYAADLRDRIDFGEARPPHEANQLGADTTGVVVVDGAGNAVSVIQSIYHEWGSGFIAGDSGVLLQNRGSFFSLGEDHVNRLEPGKRSFHTLMPGMLFRDGRPYMVYGTMGGEGQPQTSTALVNQVVDFEQDMQQAIDRPRWLYGRTWGEDTRDLRIEGRFPKTAIDVLRERKHPVRVVEEWSEVMGHAQGIRVDQDTGVLMGGADPRGEGLALGW